MSTRLAVAACLAASTLLLGCQTGLTNGDTVSGSVVGKALTFSGFYNIPNTQIRIEVMNNPTLDPSNNANWSLLTTTTTNTTPLTINSTDPLYSWNVSATPVPSSAFLGRWPQGGLVRLRAVHPDASGDFRLVTFDDVTFGDCLSEQLSAQADWTTIGLECAGMGSNTVALVSTSNIPVLPGGPGNFSPNGFLGRKGSISAAETLQYYNTTNAPTTLTAFKNKYGFPSGEITATYYNDGDLGLGREMHCKTFVTSTFNIGLACYVNNYSGVSDSFGKGVAAFNVDPNVVLADAVAKQHSFATVAMVYEPPNGNNAVKFVVYDANGFRANTAALDSTGNNTSIPNNCLSCHGINSSYNASTNAVSANARFLPFDPFSFKFSSASGYTFAAQADSIRRLNSLVRSFGNPTPGIAEFIDGTYAPKAVSDPTAVANDDFVPDDWALVNGSLVGTSLYRGVVKVACRTCHMSATTSSYDFADYADFSGLISLIKADVCGSHVMPHAERVMKNFWQSGARAYLITGFPPSTFPDPYGACKP